MKKILSTAIVTTSLLLASGLASAQSCTLKLDPKIWGVHKLDAVAAYVFKTDSREIKRVGYIVADRDVANKTISFPCGTNPEAANNRILRLTWTSIGEKGGYTQFYYAPGQNCLSQIPAGTTVTVTKAGEGNFPHAQPSCVLGK